MTGGGGAMNTDTAVEAANDIGVLGTLSAVILVLAGLLWVAYRSLNRKLESVDRAVNTQPAGSASILDRVKRIESTMDKLDDWFDDFNRHGWPSLPPDIGDAAALTDTIRIVQRRLDEIDTRDIRHQEMLETVLRELREHVEWEMAAKYGLHGERND